MCSTCHESIELQSGTDTAELTSTLPHAMVPAHCASTPASQLKVWQVWQGTHTFWCDGRIMVGPDIGVTFFAALVTTAACMVFWVFVCSTLPLLVFAGSTILYLLTLTFMLLTATVDPGIVPRNMHMEDAEAASNAQATRAVEINGVSVPLKWCHTCRIWRPPRASHCSECNVCVERFDHHCPWMGQCIGRRNYRFFIGFVVSVCSLCIYIASFALLAFINVMNALKVRLLFERVVQGFQRVPLTGTMLVFPLLILLCVGPLACYHCGLVVENKTTNEEIKGTYSINNPFSRGWRLNCQEACCSQLEASRVHPRSLASEELGASMWRSDGAEALRVAELPVDHESV